MYIHIIVFIGIVGLNIIILGLVIYWYRNKMLSQYNSFLNKADEILGGVAPYLFHHRQHEAYAAKHNQGHPHAVVEHNDQQCSDNDAGDEQLRQALREKLAQGVDVVCVVAHDIAMRMRVEISNRQILHVLKQRFAHLFQSALCNHGKRTVIGQ